MRLKDADALVKKVCFRCKEGDGEGICAEFCRFIAALDNTPTIDAVPVVHGRWVKAQWMLPPEYHHRKCCSVCGGWALYDHIGRERTSKYCPNCGAKMNAEELTNE